ncbi:MAG: tryptophan synthase subunit alpha [Flavobacteriaceae bacterium]|nr:tryptophan synthase subunit alpha [Flavobacteriaceae bacterium]
MNRLDTLFETDKKILSIYFTAGYPKLEDTVPILTELQDAGVDLIEIGLPFSDPLADGPTIQYSSTQALQNGMQSNVLFEQLKNIRDNIHIPLIIMGYFNPILQYGVDHFCHQCQQVDIDGLIIPDLPFDVYGQSYESIFKKHALKNIFLITPQTPAERVQMIDEKSNSFLYMVSSASVTGAKNKFDEKAISYFKKINELQLKSPKLIGFGISHHTTYELASKYAEGVIIGSAFIDFLKKNRIQDISQFIKLIRSN